MQKDTHTRSVKTTKLSIYFLLIPLTCIVLLDEWLKARSLSALPQEASITQPGIIDFAVHKNFGLAFDLPFRLEFVIAISILIGLALMRTAWKNRMARPDITFSCLVIILGALGNLYDRLAYGFTVDYVIFFGRSAINFSDAVIVLGVVSLLLLSSRKKQFDKTEILT
jgi:signal peptidase II